MKGQQKHLYSVAGAVALATFLVYLAALGNDFVLWDDDQYVVQNVHIQTFDAAFLKWAFSESYASNWHPLTWISHALDYAIWGLNALGHHLTNNILHALNAFLVVILAAKLVRAGSRRTAAVPSQSSPDDRTALIAGGMTGLLFGLHPIHVESVAWVSERKDLLCAFFYLLSIMAYTGYVRSANAHREQKRGPLQFLNRHYLASLGLFILALFSKPMAVSLPAVLLILDWFPFRRYGSFRAFTWIFAEKLPFFVLSAASSAVTILAQGKVISAGQAIPLPARLIVGAKSLLAYLGKMVLPFNLVPYYPYPREISLLFPVFLISVILVTGITILCLYAGVARRQRSWLAAWSCYVAMLLPVIGIVQVGGQAMADRYAYLPSLGPFLIVGVVSAWAWEQAGASGARARSLRALGVLLVVLLTVSISTLTVRQIGVWKDSVSLWSYVIEKEPLKVPTAYINRGAYLSETGRLEDAIADLDTAIALSPQDRMPYYLRGMAFYRMGRFDKAIVDFDRTIALDPLYWEAYYYRDLALKKTGKPAR